MQLAWREGIATGHDTPLTSHASRRGPTGAKEPRKGFLKVGEGFSHAGVELLGGHCRQVFEGVVKSRSWHPADGFCLNFCSRFKLNFTSF